MSKRDEGVEELVRAAQRRIDNDGPIVALIAIIRSSVEAGVKLGEERTLARFPGTKVGYEYMRDGAREEREECATLAEWYECKVPRPSHSDIVEGVAAAIRARGARDTGGR
jgi:hypothetical protein